MTKPFVVLLCIIIAMSTPLGEEKLPQASLVEDLEVLKVNLEAYHTGLYTYTSKEEFENWFSKAKVEMEDATSYEFYRKINELNTLIQNGHTSFHLNPDQREPDLKMPPFYLYKYKEQFYVSQVAGKEYEELLGKEILQLNGSPIDEVFEKLLQYKKRDGSNVTQPKEELLASFPQTYSLAFGTASSTELLFKDQSNAKLPNIPFAVKESETDSLYEHGEIQFEIKDKIGILRMPTFYLQPLKRDKYKSKLKQFFQQVEAANIENVIIDVRNNGGGNTVAVEELLSYLLPNEFQFYQDVYQNHKKWDHSIIPSVYHYPKSTGNWNLTQGADGFYRSVGNSDGMKSVKPKKQVYKHQLYVLTNGNSLSAAAEFSAFLKQYREATFIGEETGGNKLQNTSGYMLQAGLPHSKVIASIPIILWKMNVKFENDGHGIP